MTLSAVSPALSLTQPTRVKSPPSNFNTLPMLMNPLSVFDNLMALPAIPPGTNADPPEERVPSNVPALSWATTPFVSSNFQCARARASRISVKLALTVLLPLIVTVIGLFVPVASPLQPVKTKPGFGTAVTLTVAPLVYFDRSGFRDVVPPAPANEFSLHSPPGRSWGGISWPGFWKR